MSNTITEPEQYYSPRAHERRRQFSRLLDSMSLVLMNNIPTVDDSVWENWQGLNPNEPEACDWQKLSKPTRWVCNTHMYEGDKDTDHESPCDFADSDVSEVMQWFACSDSDADFLQRHGQYVTYSDLLDTHFLAITHFGTSWDYVDSMVLAFSDCYHGLEAFSPSESEAKS